MRIAASCTVQSFLFILVQSSIYLEDKFVRFNTSKSVCEIHFQRIIMYNEAQLISSHCLDKLRYLKNTHFN